MTQQGQPPLPTSTRPISRRTPLWLIFLAWVAVWWLFGWFILAAGDAGYEPRDIPDIIGGAAGLVVFVATIELIRAVRRRLWREQDIWIDPATPGTGRTWALTAILAAVFKFVGFYLLDSSSRTGSLNDAFSSGIGAPFWAAFIVWMWFTPKPEPRGVGFYALFGVALLAAVAAFAVLILLHPTLIPLFWAEVDATGAFVQAIISGHVAAGA